MAINIKPSHKGLLHENLGIAKGKPIPTSKLKKAEKKAGPAEKKRIVFAENARKWNHGGKKKKRNRFNAESVVSRKDME